MNFYIAAILFALASLVAIAGHEVKGTVVYDENGMAAANVYVVSASFRRGGIVHGRTSCRDVQVTKTDSGGQFLLRTERPFEIGAMDLILFAPGREERRPLIPVNGRFVIRLLEWKASHPERRQFYNGLLSLTDCGPPAELAVKLRPLFVAMDEEAATLIAIPSGEYSPGMFTRMLDGLGAN